MRLPYLQKTNKIIGDVRIQYIPLTDPKHIPGERETVIYPEIELGVLAAGGHYPNLIEPDEHGNYKIPGLFDKLKYMALVTDAKWVQSKSGLVATAPTEGAWISSLDFMHFASVDMCVEAISDQTLHRPLDELYQLVGKKLEWELQKQQLYNE